MTSHEQLTVAEFSGEQTRPNVNENGLKKVLSIWFDLVLKPNFDFQSHFSMSKISRIFMIFFFIEEYRNRTLTFIIGIF